MPIYGILILQSIRCSPTLWAVTQPSQFRSIMDKDEFVREPQISLYRNRIKPIIFSTYVVFLLKNQVLKVFREELSLLVSAVVL